MTTIAKVLLGVLPGLGLWACVSDFSPDPYKGGQNVSPDLDAALGSAKADAGAQETVDPPVPVPVADAASNVDTRSDAMVAVNDAPCNLAGSWIVSERSTSVAAGARQINLLWHYMELSQSAQDITVTKSLLCGGSTKSPPGELVSVNMDDSPSWPAYQQKSNYNGRKGSSAPGGGGCNVKFEQSVLVRAATVSTYGDPSVALPTLDQKSDGTTPGWEDWDNDGNPGLTMNVTSLGVKIYTCFRTVSSYSGVAPVSASTFKLDTFDWMQKRIVYGTDSDPVTAQLVTAEATRSPKAGDNFVEFARLSPDQATGSDDAICNAIRTLKDTLNPTANPKP